MIKKYWPVWVLAAITLVCTILSFAVMSEERLWSLPFLIMTVLSAIGTYQSYCWLKTVDPDWELHARILGSPGNERLVRLLSILGQVREVYSKQDNIDSLLANSNIHILTEMLNTAINVHNVIVRMICPVQQDEVRWAYEMCDDSDISLKKILERRAGIIERQNQQRKELLLEMNRIETEFDLALANATSVVQYIPASTLSGLMFKNSDMENPMKQVEQ